jgi:hypothetical protein
MSYETNKRETALRKPYEPPKLTHYGDLKDLTTGGSGNANEGSMGQRPRP